MQRLSRTITSHGLQGLENAQQQRREMPQAHLHSSATSVVLSAQLTCSEWLFMATIGRIIQLIELPIWVLANAGLDLSPFFFPLPFFHFYHARLMTNHYCILGARVCLNAEYADAYFLYLQERMLNFVTVGLYKKCCGETYPKWLDSKLQWIGAPPPGYNNHFRIFFNKGSLCERITYYITSILLFTLFGWLPFFRPIFLCWHYKQMVSRLVFGGSQVTLDSGYDVCSFYGAYCASCCGCCGHRILVFVDSHLRFHPSGILPEEGERDMGMMGRLAYREAAPSESTTPSVDVSYMPSTQHAPMHYTSASSTVELSNMLSNQSFLQHQVNGDEPIATPVMAEGFQPQFQIGSSLIFTNTVPACGNTPNPSSYSPSQYASAPATASFQPVPLRFVEDGDVEKCALLAQYFHRCDDPHWLSEVLIQYNLKDDSEDLQSNGLKKGHDLKVLLNNPSVIQDLAITAIAKAKLRALLADLSRALQPP